MLTELEAAQNLLKYVHYHIKLDLDGLDEVGLNWTPPEVAEANSIYGIALHVANTQIAFASAVSKQKFRLEIPAMENVSSRADLFRLHGTSVEVAKAALRQAADITNKVFEQLTPTHLDAEAVLPGGSKGTGRSWIALMLTHTAEHMGHISLTRQLYNQQLATTKALATS